MKCIGSVNGDGVRGIGCRRNGGSYRIQIFGQVVNKGEKRIDITTSLNDAPPLHQSAPFT